jgi:hypothetical protein
MWTLRLRAGGRIGESLAAVEPEAVQRAGLCGRYSAGKVPAVFDYEGNCWPGAFEEHLDLPPPRRPDPEMNAAIRKHFRPNRQPPL